LPHAEARPGFSSIARSNARRPAAYSPRVRERFAQLGVRFGERVVQFECSFRGRDRLVGGLTRWRHAAVGAPSVALATPAQAGA
jgi:hypothetical protein